MFNNHSFRSQLIRITFFATLCLLVIAVGVRHFLSSRPWPATTQLLPANADCRIDDQIVSNEATRNAPIRLSLGQRVVIEGDLESWDYAFATSTLNKRPGEQVVTRDLSFLMVFRQMKYLSHAGTERYDGNTGRNITADGSSTTFVHSATAPVTPGQYRLQLLALERSPSIQAKLNPLDAMKPIGVLAEALVSVK